MTTIHNAALSPVQRPEVSEAQVEAAARVLAPEAWKAWDRHPGRAGGGDRTADAVEESKVKARAALAAALKVKP